MVHRVVLLVLILASLWSFFETCRSRLKLGTVKNKRLPLDNLGARIQRILSEVVLQTRVIKNRPFVGLMHALVMWGFVVFAWVSLNHLWLGFTGLKYAPGESWYRTFTAFWAVAVIFGIGSLAYRRFVLRPKVLGDKLSLTSGVVTGLILTLMATYLLDWADYFTPVSTAWKANWWIHTLALLAFPYVIPRSKHLHLVLAPVAIFFRPETTSSMRPLDIENEDMGLIKFAQLDLKNVLDINACVECGRCTSVCPANMSGQTLNPKEIILQTQRGFLNGGDMIAGTSEEVSAKKAWVSETDLFQCFSCGACEQACPVGIEHVGAKILDLRRGLVSEGRTSSERLDRTFVNMSKMPHNPWGLPQNFRDKFVSETGFPKFDGTQEWLFWLGCGNSYDPHGQTVAKSMMKVLQAAGASWGVLEQETCCGEPARRMGNEMLFLELSQKLIDRFRKLNVRNIVTCCPHCLSMLDKDYRQLPEYAELGIKVLHHSELITTLLPKLDLNKNKKTVAYHDPCNLARGRKTVSEPRAILRACGSQLKEMEHNKAETLCCGAGGGQLFIADDSKKSTAESPNRRRFSEFTETKADILAVACPYCPIMLSDAAGQEKNTAPVLDIAEIVADSLAARP